MARYEDDIIAWLWRVYIETNGADPFVLPYLPMTKVGKNFDMLKKIISVPPIGSV